MGIKRALVQIERLATARVRVQGRNQVAANLRNFFGLRARLGLVALLVVSPLIIDRIRLVETERKARLETAAKETLSLARHGLDAHQEVVVATQAMLHLVRRVLEPIGVKSQACGSALAGVTAEVPWINGLSIVDTDGRVTCSTSENSIGLDFSERPYFGQALKTNGFVLSDYIFSRGARAPAIVGAQRITIGEFTGVLVASVGLQWIGRVAASIHSPQSTVLLLDDHGTVVAVHPPSEKLAGRTFAEHILTRTVFAEGDGAVHALGFDGVPRIFGFALIPGTNTRLLVGKSETEILGSVDREARRAYLQLALVLAIVMVAWLIGARLIMEPIRSLARIATRFGSGQLSARIPDRALVAEFLPLTTALENMARKLAARENDLLSSNQQLERLAKVDALTGIANRRTFDTRLAEEWAHAARERTSLALMMIDIDYFKLFNDQKGHVEGDLCLQAVGRVLASATVGRSSLAARYGGEEFVVLLPESDAAVAQALALDLCRTMEALAIGHPGAPTSNVTISIGVAAAVPTPEQNGSALVEMADLALYEAKRHGRNQVRVHRGSALAIAS